jgi:hypothetical protein
MAERRIIGRKPSSWIEMTIEGERPSREVLLRALAYVRRCAEERKRNAVCGTEIDPG